MSNNRFLSFAWRSAILKTKPVRLECTQVPRRWNLRRAVLGLEIRGASLYLACVRPGWGRGQLAGSDVIPNFSELKPNQLQARLREFLKPRKGEEPMVVLGLPRRDVIVRLVNLPLAARRSLQETLSLQVEMFKPTDTERFAWDANIHTEAKQLAVSLVLVPRATVERFARLFAEAGYPITRLAVSQFSLLHLYLRGRQQEAMGRTILLDTKDSDAELALLEGEKLVYSRGFTLSNDHLSPEQTALSEVQQAISTLRWREGGSCTVALTNSVPQAVERVIGTLGSVERMEDRLRLDGLSENIQLGEHMGAVAVALAGLGRRGHSYRVNLLPVELRPTRQRLRHLPTYALLAANAVFLLAIAIRVPVEDYFLVRQYRREIAGLKQQTAEMKTVLEKANELRRKLVVLEEFQLRGAQPIQALADIAQRLPKDAWVNAFTYRKGQIELAGSAKSASSLLPVFQASPQFEEIKFNGAITQDSSGMERFRLQMRMRGKQ